METFLSFLIASVVTLFFVRRYVRKLAVKAQEPAPVDAGPSGPATPCPRCNKPVTQGAAFCGSCGAPMALWTLHRAVAQEGGSSAARSGKPKPLINATLCIGCGTCIDACPETGTLSLVSGKAILANPDRCVGHADCTTACPTSAITLAFGGALQTLRVPSVNQNFETNLPGIFIVGELGGMGLIKTAINEGKLAVEHIRKRLQDAGLWTPPDIDHHGNAQADPVCEPQLYDLAIAGAGPAGLSAALTAHQHGLKYIAFEQGEIAATIRNYPRHKFLMAEPLEMPLIGNLYIGDTTKEALLAVWETILKNTNVRVRTNDGVQTISRDGDAFVVRTASGEYHARYVVLALGKRGTPRRLGVPGEDMDKVAFRLIEAESYSGEDILVVGGGDSAIEAALAVAQSGRNRVTLSYRGAEFNRAKERNRHRLTKAEQEGRLRVLRSSELRTILPDSVRLDAQGALLELPNRYVFVLIGGDSPEEFLQKTGVEIVEKVITNANLQLAEKVGA